MLVQLISKTDNLNILFIFLPKKASKSRKILLSLYINNEPTNEN